MGQNDSKNNQVTIPQGISTVRFYHIPKSGGTAIYNMTRDWSNFKRSNPDENHVKITDYPPGENEVGLAVIRHPYGRFESAFYHMVDACNDKFYYRFANVSDCEQMRQKGIDFSVFQNDPNEMLEAIANDHHPYHKEAQLVFDSFVIFRPQFYWVSDLEGKQLHDKIKVLLHQENLKHEFAAIAKQLGHLPKWPDEHMSNKRITKAVKDLNDRSKMILQELYAEDFEHFGFQR